jgi:hypothetical protein
MVFIGLGFRLARQRFHIFQQCGVDIVDKLPVSLHVRTGVFQHNVLHLWIVRGNDRALTFKNCLLEQLEILAGFVDAGSYQDGVAALVTQTRLHAKVKDNVGNHPIHTGL